MTVILDNTGFSVEHWGRFTEAEFIEQTMKERFYKHHPDEKRRQLLKQVYQLIHLDTPRSE
jgi:hypothetical protein